MSRYIICIGFYAGDGTSTLETPLAEKLDILKLCYESCRREGAPIAIVASGTSAGVEAVRKVIPGIPLYGIYENVAGKQRGEQAIVFKMLEAATAAGAAWIVKVAGDTFHPMPGWSARMMERGDQWGPVNSPRFIATAHSRPDWINTQVFAVRCDVLKATWPPPDADWERIGIEAQWGERIAAAGLKDKWFTLPSSELGADGCSNWVPTEEGLQYFHAHCMASTKSWKMGGYEIEPDPTIKCSVVIPARNEVGLDMQGRQLLPQTIVSIGETSAGFDMPECIVVDDCSDKPLHPWPDYKNLRVIRNPQSFGVDPSRNIGIAAATGDGIAVIDGHSRVETQEATPCMAGIQRAMTLAMQRNAMVVTRCAHLELPGHNGPPLCGGVFIPLVTAESQLAAGWNSFTPAEGVRRINGMLGACYFAPRWVWEKTQGFVDHCRIWGYSEEGLALKLAFLNIPILFYGDVTIAHWFRREGPHPFFVDAWHKFLNRAKVLRVVFDDDTFWNFWVPRMKACNSHEVTPWGPKWEEALNDPHLVAEAQRFRVRKVRTDAEILSEIFKVKL